MIYFPIKSLWTAIRNTWNKYLGYTVTVTWGDSVFVHYCARWEECLEWARCYRAGNDISVVISQYLSTQVIVRI